MATTAINTVTHCTRCGNEFGEEEFENPSMNDDDPICDDCDCELHHTQCALCQECFDDPQRWTEDQFAYCGEGVETKGIYRILEWPFYRSDYFDAWFIEDAINLVKPLPDVDEDRSGGFICPDCVRKHKLLAATNG